VGDAAPKERFDVAIIPMGDAAMGQAYSLARSLRGMWNNVEILATGKVKKRMARANDGGALLAVIIGEEELAAGEVTVRDLHTGDQARVAPDEVADIAAKAQNAHGLRGNSGAGFDLPDDPEPDGQ
jgi:histidyl-tRNA synthetase